MHDANRHDILSAMIVETNSADVNHGAGFVGASQTECRHVSTPAARSSRGALLSEH
jgi:hypothetical protein